MSKERPPQNMRDIRKKILVPRRADGLSGEEWSIMRILATGIYYHFAYDATMCVSRSFGTAFAQLRAAFPEVEKNDKLYRKIQDEIRRNQNLGMALAVKNAHEFKRISTRGSK